MENKKKLILFGMVLISLSLISLCFAATTWGGDTEAEFGLENVKFTCERTGTTSFWVDETTRESSLENCYREGNSLDGAHDTCCPTNGMSCNVDSGVCEFDAEVCEEFLTEATCEGGRRYDVGIYTINQAEGAGFCNSSWTDSNTGCLVEIKNCECVWDDEDGCEADYTRDVGCDDGSDGGGSGMCRIKSSTSEDKCDVDGYIYVTSVQRWWKDGWVDPLNKHKCEDKITKISCGDLLVKLPFFTWTNLIILVVVLFIFYLISRRYKRGSSGEKKVVRGKKK